MVRLRQKIGQLVVRSVGQMLWAGDGLPAGQVAAFFLWQVVAAHEKAVHGVCRFPALGNGPDDQGLAASGVAGGKDAGDHAILSAYEPEPWLLARSLRSGPWRSVSRFGRSHRFGPAALAIDTGPGTGDALYSPFNRTPLYTKGPIRP